MKKGFTLIELLAVIVILAIIALIAVPIVVNIINDSKKESLQRSIDLYIDHAQKAITKYQMTHPGFNPKECTIENKKLTCDEIPIEVEVKGQTPESGTIKIENNKISYENLLLEGTYYHMDATGKKETTQEIKLPKALETEDYKGYYADVDGDGTVDGVIYADLAHPQEEKSWGSSNTSYAKYSYTKEENLKEYTISKNKYKANDGFGEHEIISVKKGSSGNPRFYVMALNDFTTEAYTDPNNSNNNYPAYTTYYWYHGAYGHMSPLITENGFSKGKENTRKMIAKWKAAGTAEGYSDSPHNNQDIWKHIEGKYQEGWYIPSLGEWTAFADYFSSKEENKLTSNNVSGSYVANSGNYNSLYGLSNYYWSSSQRNANGAWSAHFGSGYLNYDTVSNLDFVRLGATF